MVAERKPLATIEGFVNLIAPGVRTARSLLQPYNKTVNSECANPKDYKRRKCLFVAWSHVAERPSKMESCKADSPLNNQKLRLGRKLAQNGHKSAASTKG